MFGPGHLIPLQLVQVLSIQHSRRFATRPDSEAKIGHPVACMLDEKIDRLRGMERLTLEPKGRLKLKAIGEFLKPWFEHCNKGCRVLSCKRKTVHMQKDGFEGSRCRDAFEHGYSAAFL